MIRSVALIGAGAMGAPMAWRVLGGGFDLMVCDRSENALAPFASAGVKVAQCAADCAGADMVVIVVATPAQMRSAIFGEDGLTSGLAPDRKPILAVMGTVPVEDVCDARDRLAPLGVRVVDAPVSGGVVRAAEGTLTIIVGGEAADVAAARPVFAAMGSNLFHCGAVGDAQKVKLVNNLICNAGTMITAEAYRLALEQGLDLAVLTEVLQVSTGRNFLTAAPEGVSAAYAAIAPSREQFESTRAIMRKDAHIAADLVAGPATDYPAIRSLISILDSAGDETFENWRRVSEG